MGMAVAAACANRRWPRAPASRLQNVMAGRAKFENCENEPNLSSEFKD
jgi:hypothetical protein